MKTLIIDNYDSFTYNLYQLIAKSSGIPPTVIKNDEISFDELCKLDFDNVIISPGPGSPDKSKDFGVCSDVIAKLNKPILGVCLGYQGIGLEYGGKVIHANQPMHGRISKVEHSGKGIFENIPQFFKVVRYHSLMLEDTLPDVIEKTAWTADGIIMGLQHKDKPIFGVQFHPESISSEYGETIINNFNKISLDYLKKNNLNLALTNSSASKDFKKSEELSEPKYKAIYRKISGLFDAEKAFVNLYKNKEYCFWLDSNKIIDELSRFSFMGCPDGPESYVVKYKMNAKQITVLHNSKETILHKSIFDFIEEEMNKYKNDKIDALPFDFSCGFVGYFGYELKEELTSVAAHELHNDDAALMFIDRFIAIDHVKKEYYLVCLTEIDNEQKSCLWFDEMESKLNNLENIEDVQTLSKPEHKDFHLNRNESTYLKDIEKCKDYITDGESYEICLTNQMHCDTCIDPLDYYRVLRTKNPAPYSAFLKFNETVSVVCSSMERFLKIDCNKVVQAKPIKGTLARGKNAEEDKKLIHYLGTDEKFYSENLMIVDLLRNDIGIVCEIGSVHVPVLMNVETYETVHQLVSTVEGKIRGDLSSIDCLKACFPGGSMTGAPKKRTMELINTFEKEARGIYSGTIGFLSLNGAADLNIVIRTAVISENKFSIGVGGAIIIMSDAQEEFDEILLKSKALVNVANILPTKQK